jgi:hypothetical protein
MAQFACAATQAKQEDLAKTAGHENKTAGSWRRRGS